MSGSIPVHPKYGVNVSIGICFWCGGDKNEILMSKGTADGGSMKMIADYEPCDECKARFSKGVHVIEADPHTLWHKNQDKLGKYHGAYPSGRSLVLTEDGVRALVSNKDMVDQAIKHKAMFVEKDAYEMFLKMFKDAEVMKDDGDRIKESDKGTEGTTPEPV